MAESTQEANKLSANPGFPRKLPVRTKEVLGVFGAVAAFLLLVQHSGAEPRGVVLIRELRQAKVVMPVRIDSYAKEGLVCTPLKGARPFKSFKYSTDPTWNPSVSVFVRRDQNSIWTAEWPAAGSEILIVVGQDGVVSLFADRQRDQWRFWSPHMTGSVALFECAPPSKPIEPVSGHENGSWDGCVMPVKAVRQWEKW